MFSLGEREISSYLERDRNILLVQIDMNIQLRENKTSSYKPKMTIYAIEILEQASKFLKSHHLILFFFNFVMSFMFVTEVDYKLLTEQTLCE